MAVVYLVGFMGCGKTAVGSELSAMLGVRFIDLDAELAERFQIPVSRILASHGERVFRQEEARIITSLAPLERAVVATGAGTYCNSTNRQLIDASGGVSVYLEATWETLRQRLPAKRFNRPKLSDLEQAEALFAHRDRLYRMARVIVAVDSRVEPKDVARAVAEALAERSRVAP